MPTGASSRENEPGKIAHDPKAINFTWRIRNFCGCYDFATPASSLDSMKSFLTTLFALALSASAADSVLVFNELQYHPANELTQTEWVELRSLQAVDVDISGWRIDGGIDYTFPAGTVMPGGGHIVIAAVPSQIAGSFGPFTGQLDNGGETIRLRNLNSRIMDELSYGDAGDWPVGADGSGATLSRRSPSAASGATQWATSSQLGGTPGAQNFTVYGIQTVNTAVASGATWKFNDTIGAPAVNWADASYDDSAWAQGPATLGTGGSASLAVTANLVERFKASAITGVADGGTISTWVDTANGAGFGDNVAQSASPSLQAYAPSLKLNATANGKAAVRFSANTQELRTSAAPGIGSTSGWVYFVVLKANATPVNNSYIIDRTSATTPLASLQVVGGGYGIQKRYDSNTGLGGPASTTPISQTNFQVVAMRRKISPLQFEIWVNGVLEATGADTGAALTPPALNIGHHATGGATTGFVGDIAEVLVYNSELSATDFNAVGSYLEAEYGIDTAFPGTPVSTTMSSAAPTYYLRKSFTFSGNPAETILHLTHTIADGAVFYLNGSELTRTNMPGGPVSHTTLASSPISSPAAIVVPTLPATSLVQGTNVLSVSLHKATGSTGVVMNTTLRTLETPVPPGPSLQFSEFAPGGSVGFFVELRNQSSAAVSTAGWSIQASTGQNVAIPSQSIPAGGYLALTPAELGFTPASGTRLSLIAPGGTLLRDAREVSAKRRGLNANGEWVFPTTATAGAPNVVVTTDAILINEIFYKAAEPTPPTLPSGEQWIELYNKSASPVDVSGWSFSEGVSYTFPALTPPIPPSGYLVVAWNPTTFAGLHSGVTALGPWSGSLSGSGETVKLTDVNGNIADEVRYHDGGRWSEWADGGGSSLELRDPNADNSKGEAWDASDESAQSTWQNVSYFGVASNPVADNPTQYNEFVFGLLDSGDFLIDDIVVADNTQGIANLIQNGTFGGGTAASWRVIGTHGGSIVDDPLSAGNKVLKVAASGATEHMHNHAETTLKNGATYHSLVAADTYTISFRAKWVRGSNKLHTRLWHNRLAVQTLLNRPTTGGTPGAINSRSVANIGPTFSSLGHAPAVPVALQPATVSIQVADPNSVASVLLFTSVNGAAMTNTTMSTSGGGVYTATVPGQTAGTNVQFYVRATDGLGAVSFFPAAGAASRAMIPWEDGRAQLTLASGAKPHNIRVVLPTADATELYRPENLMSDAAIPCTVILDESIVFYRAAVRLKSSEHGRITDVRCGYTLEFPGDDLFFGTHDTLSVDRSGGTVTAQKEILFKRLENTAGGIYASEDDIVRVISTVGTMPTAQFFSGASLTGPAIMSKTRMDSEYLDSQWENGGDGSQHKFERIYVLTQTINPTTRAISSPTFGAAGTVLSAISEDPKIPQSSPGPGGGVALTNLGANKEFYRWYWLLQNNREADDFSGIMNVVNAVGQTAGSANFNNLTDQHINVSAWLRAAVPATLFGVIDNYLGSGGGGHNTLIYFPPGQKAVLIPWDCDFLSQTAGATTSSLTAGGDVAKFIANPVWKRLYYGHMLDILNRSFNTSYMTTWATHYQRFSVDEMVNTSVVTYLTPRAAHAMTQINAAIPSVAFTRTSASPVTVSTPFTTVTGDGWIDIAEIRLQGSSQELATTWTDDNSWSLPLPVSAGTNTYTLVAYNSSGVSVGTATVTVTGNGGISPATTNNLIVSELNFNPPGPDDTTEFIELQNITASTLDLSNCHFDEEFGQGIAYTFAGGVQLSPGARIVVARNRTAFLAMYPGASAQLAAGQYDPSTLDNGGERIVLYSAAGLPIFDFTYSDNLNPTDGGGRSLVRIVSSTNPNPTDYTWRASTIDGGNPGTSDALAFSGSANTDADADGIPALLEYELGTSDGVNNTLPLTVTRDISGALIAVFTRRANADDADLSIEAVTDLTAVWAPATANKTSDTLVGTLRTETWQITPPVGAATFFIRLKATLR